MTADGETQRPRQRRPARATPWRWPTRSRPASCTTPRRSRSPACTRASSARTCSTRARSCPRPTTRRSSTPRRSRARSRASRGGATGPAVVIGHSKTGEMDKIDGPYYFFKAIQKARHALPEWFPLVGLELGYTNIVPVDYVAARDGPHRPPARPRRAGLPPDAPPSRSARARCSTPSPSAAHAPQMAIRIDKRLTDALPKGVGSLLLQLPALKGVRAHDPRRPRDPRGDPRAPRLHRPVRHPRQRARAGGHGHRGAAAGQLRRAHLGLLGAQARPRPLQGPLVRGRHQRAHGRHHRRLERHRPRGGA